MSSLSLRNIGNMIYMIRGHKVILDSNLAELYGVDTKNLNKAVKRNELRFPEDFMFQLTDEEYRKIKEELGVTGQYGGRRKAPYAFTENGVAMLSGILNSERAILVNISIMRTFTQLRSFRVMEQNLRDTITEIEDTTNKLFSFVFERLDTIEQTIPSHDPDRKRIGLLGLNGSINKKS